MPDSSDVTTRSTTAAKEGPAPQSTVTPTVIGVVIGVIVLGVCLGCVVLVWTRKSRSVQLNRQLVDIVGAGQAQQGTPSAHLHDLIQAVMGHGADGGGMSMTHANALFEPDQLFSPLMRSSGEPGAAIQPDIVHPREIDGKALTILDRVGGGNFGDVHKGVLNERTSTGVPAYCVAVKSAKPDSNGSNNMEDLLKEAILMAQFDHANIVALIGVVTKPSDELKVVLQYCDQGALKSLLQSGALNEGGVTVPPAVALRIASDVIGGMVHLESRRFVHRDLATRNVLVGADGNCFVADFGLSRSLREGADYYRLREGAAMPIRWSAPEVVLGSHYTSASDVWSFFALMWEVWSCGQRPFGEKSNILISMMLEEVKEGVMAPDALLSMPGGADERRYTELQAMCWAVDPAKRASFVQLGEWVQGATQQLHPVTPGDDLAAASADTPSHASAVAPYQTKLAGTTKTYQPANGAESVPYQTKLAGATKTYQPASGVEAAPYQTKLMDAAKTYQAATGVDAVPYQAKLMGATKTYQPASGVKAAPSQSQHVGTSEHGRDVASTQRNTAVELATVTNVFFDMRTQSDDPLIDESGC